MTFSEAIVTCIRKYFVFQGRASRSEYWYFYLFYIILLFGFFAFSVAKVEVVAIAFILAVVSIIIPQISAAVRRLHDTGKSGWWYWITIVPLVGPIILLVFLCKKGDEFSNDYGENPLVKF